MRNKNINIKSKITLIALLFASCFAGNTNAQVSVHFNIGVQPVWGPVGYDYAEYYYIPDIDAYYNVSTQEYVYYDNYRWVTMRNLPPRYSNFDLYRAHKVVINEPSPWMHNDRYRQQYSRYRGHHDQHAIRDSREERYWENPNHPHHNEWHGNNGNNGRGNGYGHDRGRDQGHYQQQGHQEQRHDQGRGQDQRQYQQQGRGQDQRQYQQQGRGQEQRHDQQQGRQDQGHGQEERGNQGHGEQKHDEGHGDQGGHGEGHGHGR
jgi:hypothetical protein